MTPKAPDCAPGGAPGAAAAPKGTAGPAGAPKGAAAAGTAARRSAMETGPQMPGEELAGATKDDHEHWDSI